MYTIDWGNLEWNFQEFESSCLLLLVLVAVAIQQTSKGPTEDSKGEGNVSTKQAENTWMEREDWKLSFKSRRVGEPLRLQSRQFWLK